MRSRLNEIIFGYDTRAGRLFDLVLIVAIIISVIAVMLDSTALFHTRYGGFLYGLEWFFTLLFTVEYFLRIYASPRPRTYI
ncbi:MAG: hypothetical protein RLZZ385_546, partial [Pseudomonadota bacterium]